MLVDSDEPVVVAQDKTQQHLLSQLKAYVCSACVAFLLSFTGSQRPQHMTCSSLEQAQKGRAKKALATREQFVAMPDQAQGAAAHKANKRASISKSRSQQNAMALQARGTGSAPLVNVPGQPAQRAKESIPFENPFETQVGAAAARVAFTLTGCSLRTCPR